MTFTELDQFLKDCIKAEIPFPKNTMTVLVEDFYEKVPEEHHFNKDKLEYNFRLDQEMVRVYIKPEIEKPFP